LALVETGALPKTCPVHGLYASWKRGNMAKIGRNDACPCGSGKKHKRCCLATATAPILTPPAPAPAAHSSAANEELCPCCVDRLNEDADVVLDRLLDGHVDDAEALCHKLIE